MSRKMTWAMTIWVAIALVGLGVLLHWFIAEGIWVSATLMVAATLIMVASLVLNCKTHFNQGAIKALEGFKGDLEKLEAVISKNKEGKEV